MVTTVSASHSTILETVTLQLQWKHQFEFAGFYAAIHKGIYAKYGIHLELKEYQPGIDNLEEVLSGRAQYGLYHSGIIQARLEGKPLKLLANYFKRFPLVILAKPPLRTLADLKGKRLMVSRKDLDSPLYKLAFTYEKLKPDENITIVPHSFDAEPFIRNETDAMSAFLSNEPFYLEQREVAFNIIDLSAYMRSIGDMYLFTSETQAKHRPHLTQDLINASNEGWKYALEHKAEIVELILSKYSQRKSREALLYEAEKIHELIMPLPLPIGAVFEDVIQDVANFFKTQQKIAYPGNLTGFIFNYSSQQGLDTLHFTPEEHAWLAQHPKIVLGISDQFSPDVITNADGSRSGVVVEYFKLLNQQLDNKLELHIGNDWNAITQKAIQRKIDGLASSAPNPIWDKHFLYSEPFYFGYFYPYVNTDDTFQVNHITDLVGKKVGYLSGMKKAELFLNSISQINKVALNNNEEVAEALINKRIDVFVGTIDLEWWRKQHSNLNFKLAGMFAASKHPVVMSVRNDWPILIKIINRALDNIPLEIHEHIRQRWFSDLVQVPKQSKLNLTLEEQIYLNNVSVKRAVAIGRQPFNFKDNTGNIVGIAEDYWQLISSKLELSETTSEKISIEDVPTAIQNNMADIHPNIMHKEEYANYAVFSDVYDEYPIAIATRKNEGFISNAAVLEGRTVAVGINYNAYYLLKEKYPKIKFLPVPDTAAALQQVAEGNAFAAVDVLPVLQYQIGQLSNNNIAITGVTEIKYPLQIMLHKKHARLLPLINRAIADITPEEHLEINKKWLLQDVIITIQYEYLWQLIIVALLIISIILYWNRRLRLEIDYRKKIEEQLRKLSRAIEQSHNTVVITDLDANIEFVNPAFTNVTGYTFQEAIGQNPRILNSSYHTKDFYLNMWDNLCHGQVWKGEILNKRKHGELYWENVIISPIKNDTGVTTHYVAIKEDISLRKLAEQAAQEHLQRFNEAQRIAKIGSWHIDIATNVLTWSTQTYRMFGIPDGTKIHLNDFLNKIHPLDKSKVQSTWQNAQTGAPYAVEHRIIANGQVSWVVERAELQFDDNGKAIAGIGTVQDITERKLIEEALQSSQAKYQRLVEDIGPNFVIYSYRSDNIIEYVSKGVNSIFGVNSEDIIGRTWYSAIAWTSDSSYRGVELNKKFATLEVNEAALEMEFIHPDGNLRTLNVTVHAVYDINDKYICSEGIIENITERKQAELALRQSAERYRSLIAAMAEGLVMQDRNGKIITNNAAAERILGLTSDQLMNRSSIDPRWYCIHEDGSIFSNNTHPSMITLSTGLATRNIIMGVHKPDTTLTWILINSEPLFQLNEYIPYAVVTTFSDITETRNAKQQLEEQRRTLQAVLENIPAGVQVIATNGKIILTNQHAEQILKTKIIDKTPIKELNRVYSAFIYGTDILYPPEKMPIIRGLLGETSMVEDMELRHPNGSRILLQVIGVPIPDINGNINSSVVIFFDITARKEMERIRQLNENRLDALLELSRNAPNMTEEELCMAGQEAAEKLTNSKISYLHLVNPEQETAAQYQLKTERFISAPIIEDGNVKMIIGVGNKASPYDEYDLRQLQRIAEDLWHIIIRRRTETELKAARQAAEAASHAKSTFIAHISHELRTPLTGILGFAQLLLMDKSLSNIHHEYVHTMQKSGEHLLGLINEILDLARIGAGKLELNPAPVHLPTLLEEAIAITKIRADNKGLYLSLDMETLPMAVLVDPLRLNQIVFNLLGNAIKFTHHGEVKLWIRAQPILKLTDSIQITFAVLDTGPGIPADRIRHVLLPFERLANQTNEGAGLGLSISNALITKMGGQLILGSQTAPGLWAATINETPPLLITADHGTIAWFSLILPLKTIAEPIGLELIYADSELTAANNTLLTAIDIPNLSILRQAIRLTEAGNVVELQKFCDSTQKNYPMFTTQVLNYLKQFQLNELKVFLNNLETPSV